MPSFIGTGADQVPVNSMLGSLAYQNADDVKLGKVTYSGDLLGLGSLGVGTLTPVYKIHAYGAGSTIIGVEGTTDASFITRLSGVQALYLHSTTTASEINELRNVPLNVAVNGAIRWTIDGNGNSSLGGSPISNGRTFSIVNSTTGNSSFYLQNSTTGFTTSDGTVLQVTGSAAYLWNFENGTISLGTNNTEFLRITSTGDVLNLGTGATKLPEGTTAQRPASPQEGMIRKNSSTVKIEAYLNSSWVNLDAGELLSITEYTGSPGVDQSFTLNPRTKSIFVEMVAGGGAGGTVSTATYTAGYASAASYGAVGTYCIFRIPPNLLQSTYYYRIGDGGVAGGFSSGGDTILSETLAGLTNGVGRILVSGGEAGKNGDTPAPPPVAPLNQASTNRQIDKSGNFFNLSLIAHNSWESPRGFNILILGASTHLTVLSPENHSYASNEYRPAHPIFGRYGGGGKGAHKYQGGYTDGAHDGFQGMIRVYEYA